MVFRKSRRYASKKQNSKAKTFRIYAKMGKHQPIHRTINKKRKTTQSTQRNLRAYKKGTKKKMNGGAIPFSEYGLAYDNLSYGAQSGLRFFADHSPTVVNNASHPVNPNPTAQFNRTRAVDSDVKGPNIGDIFRAAYSS